MSVYMTYENDFASFDDFQSQLSVIDSLISQYADCLSIPKSVTLMTLNGVMGPYFALLRLIR